MLKCYQRKGAQRKRAISVSYTHLDVYKRQIEETIYHGYCADREEAAVRAVEAGVDIDMMTCLLYTSKTSDNVHKDGNCFYSNASIIYHLSVFTEIFRRGYYACLLYTSACRSSTSIH